MPEFEGKLSALLYVSDLQRSVDFYRHKLDFGFNGYWDAENHRAVMDYGEAGEPAYCSVVCGDNQVGLHAWSGDGEIPSGGSSLHVSVADVDAYHERLRDAGVEIVQEPADQEWGARMMTIRDPDGHRWDFLTPLEGHHEG